MADYMVFVDASDSTWRLHSVSGQGLDTYTDALGASYTGTLGRFVGATTSGSPSTGAYLVGDVSVDKTGKIWICTVAGSPGSWVTDVVSQPSAVSVLKWGTF